MLRLKADSSKLSQNGSVPNDLFADISTRSLNSVSVGESSGKISTGKANVFVGYECGEINNEGSYGVFVGFQAGQFNKNANWNTFVGSYTGRTNTRGNKNTFVGFRAGELTLDGSESTAVGVNAMRENAVGNRNVAVGISAGERLMEGDNNTMIGAEAGQNIRSGNLNTMAGYRSGRGSFKGNENTYFGAYSGYSNEMGDGNAFIGYKSGEYLTNGSYNVAVGAYTLQYATQGSCNIALGAFSGSLLTGSGNVLVGTGANANTVNGNCNTTVGTNTGFNANGGNNVYIGYETATNTQGQQNVVIGSSAFTSNNSSNSVVIGYNTADTVFKSGSNNIFIGVGADAHTSSTSYAIAIGSKDTRSGDKAISIGEEIDNDGLNSVLLGYGLYSDSDQCVSIGYQTEINNVIVFNDPLNYIFPVSTITEYDTFNLKENYTDMMYLGESNTITVATIYASNDYDSGCNLLKGVIRANTINLLDYIGSNIIYHNITIMPTTGSNIVPPYISDTHNIPAYDFVVANTATRCNLQIPIDPTYEASNLIPTYNLSHIDYEYTIGRRIAIQELVFDSNYTIEQNKLIENSIYITDIIKTPIDIKPIETSNFFSTTSNGYKIIEHPFYGDIRFEDDKVYYDPYKEGLFATNDQFRIAYATNLDGTMIVPESIKQTTLLFMNSNLPQQSNLNLHSSKPTIFNESFDSNLLDSNIQYIPPNILHVRDPTSNITTPLLLTDGRTIDCSYLPTLQNAISYSNIRLSMNSYSLESTTIPFVIHQIVQQPMYGRITNGVYQPFAFNFTRDIFKIISFDTEITVEIHTDKGSFKSQNLNMLVMPLNVSFNSNVYTQYLSNTTPVPVFISLKKIVNVNGSTIETETTKIIQTDPYIQNVGYLHTCNIDIDEIYTPITFAQLQTLPTEPERPPILSYIDTTNTTTFYDYTIYQRDIFNTYINPYIATTTYNWDYQYSDGLNPDPNTGNQILDTTYIPPVFSNINNVGSNRYVLLNKSISTTKLYKEASNTIIYNSNTYYQNDIYRDAFSNLIYIKRYDLGIAQISSSNYIYITPSVPFTEYITQFGYSNDNYITSNISTLELRDSTFYGYDMTYNVSGSNKSTIIHKNKGVVTSFHQSNITNNDIQIWDEHNVRSNLKLIDREIPIKYYSNLGVSTATVVPIHFMSGVYHLSNEIILRTENINFIDRSNVCISDGDVFIQYIDNASNVINQYIPTFYSNINPIDLNVGLIKKRRKLDKRDLFTYSNSAVVQYQVSGNDIRFYKTDVPTIQFTQKDINDGLITMDGNGSGLVDLGVATIDVNTYIQNYYLNSNSDASNIFKKNSNVFVGTFWDDIASRKDDVRIHVLNNPLKGILYSSNTNTIVNDITYSSFSNEKIHYIPFEPMSLDNDVVEIFLSYSNVASPVYSLHIHNDWVKDRSTENIVERVKITNDVVIINVDESNYTYLNRLLIDRDVIYYVVIPPENGILLNENFISIGSFTSEDIREKRVFYQNYKGTSDRFELRIGTTLYDLSLNTVHVEMNVLPLPLLLRNNYDYIYGDTLANGRVNYRRLSSDNLEISSGGVYIFEKKFMNVYVKKNGVYEDRTYFLKDEEVYYRPTPEFFQFNSNENITMKMKFFTYSNLEMNEPNKLSSLDVYKSIYNQEWFSKYNTFDSFNDIIATINSNQTISYTKTIDDNFFGNKKCKIAFNYKPVQSFLSGDQYNDFLRTYVFTYELIDFDNSNLLSVTFGETSNVATIGTEHITIIPESRIFDWNTFYMINYDDTNDDKLSLYINDINYLEVHQVESIDLSRLQTIRITVPIEDAKNLYSGTITRDLNSDGTKMYYNLQNYNTKLYFRNFEILLRITQALDTNAKYKTTYNIAIGDYLRVNGFNNICIGKNFLTTGIGSIIIGNDIGSTPENSSMLAGSFNEIFNSIIVSTSSFIETKVRDVIAIGNNILNKAGGSDRIDAFFSKKPVLIGNNITTDTLDFHVNIQNSFLKTDIGYKQIYCGLEKEAVCIGYSSNEQFDNTTNRLYINGNAVINGNIIEKKFDKIIQRYVYPSIRITNGTAHLYERVVQFGGVISDARDVMRFKCSFRYVGLEEFGYYNFESVVSVRELYSITQAKSDLGISHIVEIIEGGIIIKISFDTAPVVDYLVIDMEIESCGLLNCVFA